MPGAICALLDASTQLTLMAPAMPTPPPFSPDCLLDCELPLPRFSSVDGSFLLEPRPPVLELFVLGLFASAPLDFSSEPASFSCAPFADAFVLDSVATVDSATIEIFPPLALRLRATSASVLQPRTTLIETSAPTATLDPAAVAEPSVSSGS